MELLKLTTFFVTVFTIVIAVLHFTFEYFDIKNRHKRKLEYLETFNEIVKGLSSTEKTAQLASAVMMRRYFKKLSNQKNNDLHDEAINVISSILKTSPTGVFQKALGDGLAYAGDLSMADLQDTNLQNLYIGVKKGPNMEEKEKEKKGKKSKIGKDNEHKYDIIMHKTDFFQADLSYALLDGIDGVGAIFYNSILFNTKIKNSNFSNASFVGADLRNITFKNVILYNADFTGATNLPKDILNKIDENGKYINQTPVNIVPEKRKLVFFSIPGQLQPNEELLAKEYRHILETMGFEVFYYERDDYKTFGQFNQVNKRILDSAGMIVFGFKQIELKKAVYRPNSKSEENWDNKWLSTPWCEIEVGMGLMAGLPILIVKDDEINEGVFDPKLSEHYISIKSTQSDTRKLESDDDFIKWIELFK